ncbi:Uncharacterized protein PBTT_06377 [Plasmodiophora brassicae]
MTAPKSAATDGLVNPLTMKVYLTCLSTSAALLFTFLVCRNWCKARARRRRFMAPTTPLDGASDWPTIYDEIVLDGVAADDTVRLSRESHAAALSRPSRPLTLYITVDTLGNVSGHADESIGRSDISGYTLPGGGIRFVKSFGGGGGHQVDFRGDLQATFAPGESRLVLDVRGEWLLQLDRRPWWQRGTFHVQGSMAALAPAARADDDDDAPTKQHDVSVAVHDDRPGRLSTV